MGNAISCMTSKEKKVKRFDNPKLFTVLPKKSYICQEERFSEYIIGIICGNIFRSGMSAHFIDMFGFATCEDTANNAVKEYVFMDKIDSTIAKLIFYKDTQIQNPNSPLLNTIDYQGKKYTELDILCVQTLTAITAMQQYGIQHGDLHLDNVFLEKLGKTTQYDSNILANMPIWKHEVFGKKIYTPQTTWLVKIGDFGLSVKYSVPMVGNKETLTTGYDQNDGEGPWIPNWFSSTYDALYFLNAAYRANNSKFVRSLLGNALGLKSNATIQELKDEISVAFNSNARPRMNTLNNYKKSAIPSNILLSDVMEDFHTKSIYKTANLANIKNINNVVILGPHVA